MVSASAPGRDPASVRPRAWLLVAAVSLASAAVYADLRMGVALGTPGFGGLCERISRAGLRIGPQDWMCVRDVSHERSALLLASLLAGLGLAWPPVVLAATGRRLTALLPLVPVAGGVTVSAASASLWNGPPRISEGVLAAALDLAVLAAPAAAVAHVLRRRPRPPRPELGWLGCLIAAGVCAAGAAGILAVVPVLQRWHYGWIGGDPLGMSVPTLLPAALVMGLFGALLGSDRRWWPWSLVPAALFLSLGPSVALLSPSGYAGVAIWSPFGGVVPLFLVGLAATWWRPMALAVSTWLERSEASDFDDLPEPEAADPTREPQRRRPLRPAVILQAVAAGALAISVVVFVGDPSPVAFAEILPTYRGLREAAQDLRVKIDLHAAMSAMDAYRDAHGTDRGFDAAAGERADPTLVWSPPPSTDRQVQEQPASTIAVVRSPHLGLRIAAFSESGRAFCIQRSAEGTLAYGRGERRTSGIPAVGAWHRALATCGDRPWTSTTLAPLPLDGMCDGVGVGYLLCRSVQVLIVEELQPRGGVGP